jgi:tetratricopeptide (TPR) repeat protein
MTTACRDDFGFATVPYLWRTLALPRWRRFRFRHFSRGNLFCVVGEKPFAHNVEGTETASISIARRLGARATGDRPFASVGGLMKHVRMTCIAIALLIGCPCGVNAGQFFAQANQPGQQQPPPQYTKEQIEELKKQNERAQKQNALIKQANEAMTAKNWQAAVAPLGQLIADDPNNWAYASALGDVQFNLGAYDQAIAAYEKGIRLAESGADRSKNNDPAGKKAAIGKMLTQEGNSYLKLRKNKEAVAAFSKAASLDINPGIAYFNLCATQYNIGNTEGALDACGKAITADPSKADAYFIKGSLLVGESKTDSSGKLIAPPGAADALKKYLELAPDGTHAKDVKEMLALLGSNVETTYQKGKGK